MLSKLHFLCVHIREHCKDAMTQTFRSNKANFLSPARYHLCRRREKGIDTNEKGKSEAISLAIIFPF